MHEAQDTAAIVPEQVIGTSIDAIIAGNAPQIRAERLGEFWDLVANSGNSLSVRELYADARNAIARAPWQRAVSGVQAVVIHQQPAQ
jgi:hypothetical protein